MNELIDTWTLPTTADDVASTVERVYGGSAAAEVVLHVTAVWRRPDGQLRTLAVTDDGPHHPIDTFALAVARARADAIVTTGKILRDEPTLSHQLPSGPEGALADAVAAWRRTHLGRRRPPVSAILTSTRSLDFEHPLFSGGTRPLIFTGQEAAHALAVDAARRGIMIVGAERPSIRDAVETLKQHGCDTISVEAGPSSSVALYEPPTLIDEVMLTVHEPATPLAPHLDAGPAPFPATFEQDYETTAPGLTVEAPNGTWTLHRYRRRAGASPAAAQS